MRAYGSTFSAMTMSDVNWGDGHYGEPTRTNRLKSKNRSSGRRYLHKLGRREGSNDILNGFNEYKDDEYDCNLVDCRICGDDEGYLYEE